jgi:hypothetical protein
MHRYFFSGASEAELDKQGRVMVPSPLGDYAGLGKEVVVVGIRDHLEIWDRAFLARAPGRDRRECRGCCRASCNQARLITFPYSPTRFGSCLRSSPERPVVDATFGAGGHAALLAADLRGEGRLIAIDRDPSARAYFDRFRKQTGIQGRFLRGDFSIVLEQLADNGAGADAILFDLGVSSMQIDRPERGFSYAADAPLDMRMDPSADYSARELVNEAFRARS